MSFLNPTMIHIKYASDSEFNHPNWLFSPIYQPTEILCMNPCPKTYGLPINNDMVLMVCVFSILRNLRVSHYVRISKIAT